MFWERYWQVCLDLKFKKEIYNRKLQEAVYIKIKTANGKTIVLFAKK